MGTPDFAVVTLKKLIEEGFNIVGVVTAPDKPAGRGQKISKSAVKEFAESHDLTIIQPLNLKDNDFQNELKSLNADIFVVVAFRMLPESIWQMPPKGTINLHASLLPQYRGAAPINWAIINGETETGVTTFFIEKEIDTGKIILQDKITIESNMTAGELHEELASIGSELMKNTLILIANDQTQPTDQKLKPSDTLRLAPKIFKSSCEIEWEKGVNSVHNFIRGLSPYPGAWCKLQKDNISFIFKLSSSETTSIQVQEKGNIFVENNKAYFPCNNYYVAISEIQLEGKRKMTVKEFQAGNDICSYNLV